MQSVIVDGREIPAAAIAAELQHHPAPDVADAWRQAATALVIRRLLLDECARQGIAGDDEEAAIRALLAREIAIPDADAATCRRYWTANRARFRTPDVYEASHILFPAPPDDEAARAAAKSAAAETLRELAVDPRKFNELARTRSACPSAPNGGRLGQLTRSDLVPEIETFVFALEQGQLCPVPVMTRYGAHSAAPRPARRRAGIALRISQRPHRAPAFHAIVATRGQSVPANSRRPRQHRRHRPKRRRNAAGCSKPRARSAPALRARHPVHDAPAEEHRTNGRHDRDHPQHLQRTVAAVR